MTSTRYLRGQWPTPRFDRLTYGRLAELLFDAGWGTQPREKLVTAVAVFRAESGFDPVAYLAYLQVPGDPGGSLWQRKVYERNVAWLRKQKTTIALEYLPGVLRTRPLYHVLPHRQITLPATTDGRPRVDFGLGQLNSQYHPIIADPYENALYCYQHVYLARDETFTGWAAYTNDSYRQFMTDARHAVSRMLDG